MILGAHQPHFIPWLGYLDKVLRSDVFVVVDHVQFERQNYQNRNRVLTRSGVQWITVPVQQISRSELIRDKLINNNKDGRTSWGEKIFNTLRHAYGAAPYFRDHEEYFADTLTRRWDRLLDLTDALFHYLLQQFAIRTPIVRSSALPGVDGMRSEMILNMCLAAGADVYLSGSGGSRRYLDTGLLDQHGISVAWQDFHHPRYAQVQSPDSFVSRLSAVDLLFHCGPDSAEILRGERPGLRRPATEGGVHRGAYA